MAADIRDFAYITRDGLVAYLLELVMEIDIKSGAAAPTIDRSYVMDRVREISAAVDGKTP